MEEPLPGKYATPGGKTTLYFDKQIERILPIVTLSNSSVILNELTTNDILVRKVFNPSLHVLAVQYQQLTKKKGEIYKRLTFLLE